MGLLDLFQTLRNLHWDKAELISKAALGTCNLVLDPTIKPLKHFLVVKSALMKRKQNKIKEKMK